MPGIFNINSYAFVCLRTGSRWVGGSVDRWIGGSVGRKRKGGMSDGRDEREGRVR